MVKKTIQNTTYDVAEVLQQGNLLAQECVTADDKAVFAIEVVKFCLVVKFAANAIELIEAVREALLEEHDIDCDEGHFDGLDVAALFVAQGDAEYAEEICATAKQVAHRLYEQLDTMEI